jgi:hypothetical protein
MNSRSKGAKRSEYLQIPESLRMVLETAATAEWVSMRELADKEAEARWRDKNAASEKQLEEMTAVCAVLTEEKRALSARLIEVEANAVATDRKARDDAESTTRRLKESEEAQRASKCAAEIASDTAKLKVILDAAQSLFAKIETAQHTPIARCKCIEDHAIKGESSTISKLADSPLPLYASDSSRLNSADVIAAARIILTAASSLQAIGTIFAACLEFGHVSRSGLVDGSGPGIKLFEVNPAIDSSVV